MADNYEDSDLEQQDELDLAEQADEQEDAAAAALPVRNRSKKNLQPLRADAPEVAGDDLANFDFNSLIKTPEPAPAAPKQEPGLLESAGKAIKNFIKPDKDYLPGSVMNDVPDGEKSKAQAPIAPGVRRALEAQYDAATPEERVKLASRPGAAGDVWRQRESDYSKRTTASPTLDKIDPSAEARAGRYIDQGMDRQIAQDQGRVDAAQGVIGQTVGEATVSKFDFETAEKYAKDPFFSNPVVRGAVKGLEGYKQGVIGINQFVADMVGADEAAGHYKQMAGESEDFVKAIGDPANYGQRMFEGAVSSIAQQIPALLGGTVTGSQALVLSAMAVQAYGQQYSEGRAAGQTIDQASVRAAQMAAFEVIGEKIGLGDQLGALRRLVAGNKLEEAVKLMVKSSIKEVPGEQVTTLGQFAVDKEGAGYGIRREAEIKDLVSQMQDTLVQTMMQGGIMTGTAQAVKSLMPEDGSVPATTREPESDIMAQVKAMTDPNNPKDSVFIAEGTPVPQDLPEDIQVIERPEGVLLTNNPEKARIYGESEQLTDDMMAEILGLPKSKSEVLDSTEQPEVVQARDPEGNVVNEAVTDGTGANEQAVADTVPPGGEVVVRTPEEAQSERAAKVQQESIVPGQEDSNIDDLLKGVKEVDENGNEIIPEGPATPPEAPPAPPGDGPATEQPELPGTPPAPPEQPGSPPVEDAGQPPDQQPPQDSTQTPPVAPPKPPKAPKAPKEPPKVPGTPKESFAQKMGAQYKGDSLALEGRESKQLGTATRKSDTDATFKRLAKSTNPTIRFVGEAAQKRSERYGRPLKLDVSDQAVEQRIKTRYNDLIEGAQRTVGTMDALRSVRDVMANYRGTGIPASIKGKMILPAGAHSKHKSGLTLGKVLKDAGVTTKAQFEAFSREWQRQNAGSESLLREYARLRKMNPKNVGGLHDPMDHTVLLRRAKAESEHVVAHEITHALTSEAIDSPTDAQIPYVQALERLFAHVQSNGSMAMEYGLTNVKEFIAEGFSNPDFQYQLAQIPYEGDTVWGKFTKLIAKLLGVKHDNAFVELIRIGEGLMDLTQTGSPKGAAAPSASNGEISFMARQRAIQGKRFSLPAETRMDSLQNALQDRFNRIKRVQDAVVAQGGVVTTDSNIYKADERYHGAAASKVEWFTKYMVKPLMRDMGRAGVDPDEVGLYLYALHARERNDQIASINPAMPDGGSGMTNAEAAAILRSFRTDPNYQKIKAFAKRLHQITAETRKIMLEGHLIDQDTLDAWDKTYANYVPLKGFENYDEMGQKQAGTGRGYDVRGPESRRALGRESRAGNIIENIIMDHERAINRAERNKVSRALLRFVLQNRDPNLWEVNKVVHKAQLRKSPSPGQVLYRLETMKDKDRTITVKENGKELYILIKDQKMFSQLQGERGALNMEGSHATFFKAWSWFNRFLTKMWTALNPAFTLINAVRDTTTAIVHGSTAVGPGFAARVAVRAPTAIRAIWRAERRDRKLTIGPNGPQNWEEWYQQYQEDGGKAGFYMFEQLEDKERELRNIFQQAMDIGRGTTKRKAWAQTRRALTGLHDIIMDANGAIENMNRVAAYRVAIEEYNMSREEAASLAKNLTVNFNRRGTLAPLVGSFYLFFNPAVQGTTRIYQAFKSNKAMMSGFLGSMVGMGYLAAMMAEGDEDENGMPWWDKIPTYEKEKNFIISKGDGKRWTLPMAYGYGFFVHMGYLLRDLQRGRPMSSVSLEMLDSAMAHFVPVAYQRENPTTAMVPTVAIPVLEAYTNQRSTGGPLMPEARKLSGREMPDSQRYWNATKGTLAQQVSEMLNTITGGDEFEGGLIDISPESMKNAVRGYLGGGGTFVYDSINSIAMAAKGSTLQEIVDQGAAPFAKGFHKADNGKGDQNYFMKHSKEAMAALDRFKELQDSDDPAVVKRLEKTRDLAELGASIRSINKATGVLRKQQLAIQADTEMSEAEKKEALKEIEKERTSLYSEWNAAFFALERKRQPKE